VLMSDAGGSIDAVGATLRFDDAAATFLPEAGPLVTSTNKPTDYPPADTFGAPAPAGPYATTLSVFNGATPNGPWSLFVVDDRGADFGVISNGWRLTITTVDPATVNDLAVGLADAPDPITAGLPLVYTVSVTNLGPLLATGVLLSDPLPAGVSFV